MVTSQLHVLVNFIPDHATKHLHIIVSNFRKTFHLFLEYGELPALPILQFTFNHATLKALSYTFVRQKQDWIAQSLQTQKISQSCLKALFNNVFTFENLSCMSLHAISVFDKV